MVLLWIKFIGLVKGRDLFKVERAVGVIYCFIFIGWELKWEDLFFFCVSER